MCDTTSEMALNKPAGQCWCDNHPEDTRCQKSKRRANPPPSRSPRSAELSAVDGGNTRGFVKNKKIHDFFQIPAGEDTQLCWQDLQKVLSKTMQKEFSKEVCRSLITMVDKHQSGKIDIEEIQELCATVQHWNEVFEKFNIIYSGHQIIRQLREALDFIGYELDDHTIDNLICRFSNKNGKMEFDDFLICAVRVKTVIDTFNDKALGLQNPATFTQDEWMKKTLYL